MARRLFDESAQMEKPLRMYTSESELQKNLDAGPFVGDQKVERPPRADEHAERRDELRCHVLHARERVFKDQAAHLALVLAHQVHRDRAAERAPKDKHAARVDVRARQQVLQPSLRVKLDALFVRTALALAVPAVTALVHPGSKLNSEVGLARLVQAVLV
eukprot:364126-Chlamydomonas_euryale.AAC.1